MQTKLVNEATDAATSGCLGDIKVAIKKML